MERRFRSLLRGIPCASLDEPHLLVLWMEPCEQLIEDESLALSESILRDYYDCVQLGSTYVF